MPSPPPARRPKNPNVHHGDTETRRAHGENGVDQTLAAPVLPVRSDLETSKRNLTATTDGHDPLTETIIGAAIEVHRALGPGLLESAYQECLVIALRDRGLSVARQVELPIEFHGHIVKPAYRIDVEVNQQVIVEVKAVESILPVHEAQLLTYLRLSRRRIGLLINFCVPMLKDGVRRRVL
ncbi:MAG: GxxExxY protein [Phycisphaeraceae bacterium]|nr:GxxExxY protein [Phycisphaeraceae bacterium]